MSVTVKKTYDKYPSAATDEFDITFDFDVNESETGEERIEVEYVDDSGVVQLARELNDAAPLTSGYYHLLDSNGDPIPGGDLFRKAEKIRLWTNLSGIGTNLQNLYIFRVTELTQPHQYLEGDKYFSTNNERVVDKTTHVVQEHRSEIDRTFTLNRTIDPAVEGINMELPNPEIDKFIKWDSAGVALENAESFTVKANTNDPNPGYLDAKLLEGNAIDITPEVGNEQLRIDVDPSELNHDSLSGFVADEHVPHSSVSILAGPGLTGGGDLTATRTLSLDAGTLNHDDLANIPANQHVDHTLVSVDPGTGLAGGGPINTSQTLQVDPDNAVAATPAANDYVLFHDRDEPGTDKTKKTTISDIGIIAGADGKDVRVTGADVSSGFLDGKIGAAAPVTKTVTDTGGGVLRLDMGLDQTALAIKSTQVTDFVNFAGDPGGTDDQDAGYEIGSFWLNTAADKVWYCKANTPNGSAQWIEASGGGGTGGDRPTWKLTGALGVYSFFDGYWVPDNTDPQVFAEIKVALLDTGTSGQTDIVLHRDGTSGALATGPFSVPATGTVGVVSFPIAPTVSYVEGDYFWVEITQAAAGADELTVQLNNASAPASVPIPIEPFDYEVAIGNTHQTINEVMAVAASGSRIYVRSHLALADLVGTQVVNVERVYIEFAPNAVLEQTGTLAKGLSVTASNVSIINPRFTSWDNDAPNDKGLVLEATSKNTIIRGGRFDSLSTGGYDDLGANNSIDVIQEIL